jgi:hypothetical protein
MVGGRVVEQGDHDELLASGGRYSDLWWEEMRTERYAESSDVESRLPQLRPTVPAGGHDDRSTTP